MTEERQAVDAWEYVQNYYNDAEIAESFRILAQFRPDVVKAYIDMRSSLFRDPPSGALPQKYKELVIIAMECMAPKVNPPPTFHAQKAVDAGATLEEIAEVVSMAIMIGGMITYQEAGRFVLKEAEHHLNLKAENK